MIARSVAGICVFTVVALSAGPAAAQGQPQSAALAAPAATPGICNGTNCVRPFIDTWNNIHLAQIFDYKISDPASVAPYYDFVWGADTTRVSAWRSGNPNIFLSYYIPFSRDNGTFTDSTLRTLEDYWKPTHPEWVLYKCDANGNPTLN